MRRARRSTGRSPARRGRPARSTALPSSRAARGVPLALVTDGQRWTLVWAREGESTGTCTWRAELWLEEPVTLRAFTTLLGARRFFALPLEEGLAALLEESAARQQEVADQLGAQVRRAVELLIATLDREDRDRHGELLQHLESAEVYRGAVTVMMRLVFLFVAEERRLLPIDDPRYAETLAASTLRAQLQERADRYGEDPLERSTAAWHRVLALFRAVHGGIEHDALRLPAYGGGLFDPDRYPFLEGRAPGTGVAASRRRTRCRSTTGRCFTCSTRCRRSSRAARACCSPTRRSTSSRSATSTRACSTTPPCASPTPRSRSCGKHRARAGARRHRAVGGCRRRRARRAARQGDGPLGERDRARRSDAELPDDRRARLRAACGNDDALLDRVAPYHALLRDDLRGDPLVFLPGSLFVTQALDRRASGTYYTPRELAEEVVRHALDPVVYDPGPAQERDPAKWKLKTVRRAARPQDRRHRDGLRRVPRRRLPLPRRPSCSRPGPLRPQQRDGAGGRRSPAATRSR